MDVKKRKPSNVQKVVSNLDENKWALVFAISFYYYGF